MNVSPDNLLPAHGDPLFAAVLKSQPQDFVVDEDLAVDFSENGEHLYVQIEKCSINTDEVVMLITKTFGCQSADVGVAGMKDRHAQTSQWFSVRTPQSVTVLEAVIVQFNEQGLKESLELKSLSRATVFTKRLRLLNSCRHHRKLRRGAHRGNRFVITLRELAYCTSENPVAEVDRQAQQTLLAQRVAAIAQFGFPNYLGPQRFGNGMRNLTRAQQWFRNPRKRASRVQRSLWLSAARSALFNVVCRARVSDQSWQLLMQGEPAMLAGTRSFFVAEESSETDSGLADRLGQFDIHPTGPWWGRGNTDAVAHCADYEQKALAAHGDLCNGLERSGSSQERRALRACATDLSAQWLDDGALQLRFSLLPGVFATTLLNELGLCLEPQRGSNHQADLSAHQSSALQSIEKE